MIQRTLSASFCAQITFKFVEFLLLQVVKAVAWQPFSNNAHQAEKAETGAEELDEEVPSK